MCYPSFVRVPVIAGLLLLSWSHPHPVSPSIFTPSPPTPSPPRSLATHPRPPSLSRAFSLPFSLVPALSLLPSLPTPSLLHASIVADTMPTLKRSGSRRSEAEAADWWVGCLGGFASGFGWLGGWFVTPVSQFGWLVGDAYFTVTTSTWRAELARACIVHWLVGQSLLPALGGRWVGGLVGWALLQHLRLGHVLAYQHSAGCLGGRTGGYRAERPPWRCGAWWARRRPARPAAPTPPRHSSARRPPTPRPLAGARGCGPRRRSR